MPYRPNAEFKDVNDLLPKTVLNSLSANIAILDAQGVIMETNRSWINYAGANQMKGEHDSIGVNYLEICEAVTGEEATRARKVADGIRSVIKGDMDEFLFDYPCHSPDKQHWYYMRVIRIQHQDPVQVVVSHEDITALKLAEEALKTREQELELQKQSLEESNIALKVLLTQREADKVDLEKKFLLNIKQMVLPYLDKLRKSRLKPREKTFVEIIDAHVNDIISPFLQNLAAAGIFFTPQEMQVATLIRDGKSSKEIADLLNVSPTTIHFHRKNLRAKLKITNKSTNLRSYLLSLS
ncbi:MAG: LuxR C-terminal-related transcriptional regulator [Thermodesulfobacteriota bacterium]|nr:LuxR C-terminal-related transcriptional regulator [Thermodesulfobacteriota bacterium]